MNPEIHWKTKVSVLQNYKREFYLQTWLNTQIRSLRKSLHVFTLSCTFVSDGTLIYHLNASTLEMISECTAISELLCLSVWLLPVCCTMHPAVCVCVCVFIGLWLVCSLARWSVCLGTHPIPILLPFARAASYSPNPLSSFPHRFHVPLSLFPVSVTLWVLVSEFLTVIWLWVLISSIPG